MYNKLLKEIKMKAHPHLIEYIRGYKDKPVGVMVAIKRPYNSLSGFINTNLVTIGISVCHKSDVWDKEIGRSKAFHRTDLLINRQRYQLPISHKREIYNFYERCIRYFKNDLIILPNIEWIVTSK